MKNKIKITAHCLVKNEERFIWFSVMSVLNYVDEILLWDTGSTDGTLEIIKELLKFDKEKKIKFREVGSVDSQTFTKTREEMLTKTKSGWFIILDGDEVWWDDSVARLVNFIHSQGVNYESIISPVYNLIGDIYHYQDNSAGLYVIDEYKGHFNIRAVNRNIPGLHFAKPHGQQGLYDKDDVLIQNRAKEKRIFLDSPYMHFTNILRAASRADDLKVPKREGKMKYGLGIEFPYDFYYPEVFFRPKPDIVPSPWDKRSRGYAVKSFIVEPLRKLKSMSGLKKVGY